MCGPCLASRSAYMSVVQQGSCSGAMLIVLTCFTEQRAPQMPAILTLARGVAQDARLPLDMAAAMLAAAAVLQLAA